MALEKHALRAFWSAGGTVVAGVFLYGLFSQEVGMALIGAGVLLAMLGSLIQFRTRSNLGPDALKRQCTVVFCMVGGTILLLLCGVGLFISPEDASEIIWHAVLGGFLLIYGIIVHRK